LGKKYSKNSGTEVFLKTSLILFFGYPSSP
jgi:hypothetical protein